MNADATFMPPTIAVDIGNSRFHFATRTHGTLNTTCIGNNFAKKLDAKSEGDLQTQRQAFAAQLQDCWQNTITSWLQAGGAEATSPAATVWYVSSVHDLAANELLAWLASQRPQDSLVRISQSQVPIPDRLENRQATGIDRLLAAWFAYETLPQPNHDSVAFFITDSNAENGVPGLCEDTRNVQSQKQGVIVVDAGSAVTVDWVDSAGVFQGGMIYPGLQLSARSLSIGTDALPNVQIENANQIIESVFGRSTIPAIQSGLFWSQWGSICQSVKRLQQVATAASGSPAAVVLTGGGIKPFLSLIPADWNYSPDLMLDAILHFSHDNRKLGREVSSTEGAQ